ncbi:hypothetical protein HHI36_013901 [Cryptolaemus montrouzieri]|uniref:lysozyme n=1 Tax=Cryptolaemus montrouzieri TaxID=559131 RepID=A0ABD2N290_9CUCU
MRKYLVRMNFWLLFFIFVGVKCTLDFQCYRCICELYTDCKDKPCNDEKCKEINSDNYNCACGPFSITPGYWLAAKKPSLDGNNDTDEMNFKKCAKSIACSRIAVQYNMEKYAEDCDGNKVIDCYDYVLIHNFGAHACFTKRFDNQTQMKFDKCMGKVVDPFSTVTRRKKQTNKFSGGFDFSRNPYPVQNRNSGNFSME